MSVEEHEETTSISESYTSFFLNKWFNISDKHFSFIDTILITIFYIRTGLMWMMKQTLVW